MGCQNHLFGGPRGVTFGGSGVSIGGVGSLRVEQKWPKSINFQVLQVVTSEMDPISDLFFLAENVTSIWGINPGHFEEAS